MNQFRTEFNDPVHCSPIHHGQSILCMGSCFAQHIFNKLSLHGFDATWSPFGICYHASVLAQQLDRLMEQKKYTSQDLHFDGQLYHSFDHHGQYSNPDRDQVLHSINSDLEKCNNLLSQNSVLIITLGSSIAYERNGQAVANCHKINSNEFTKRRYSVDELYSPWQSIIKKWVLLYPASKIIFTVSPVRYLKEGMIANTRSKAVLHLLIDRLQTEYTNISYFPAYEIMLDDLREYRFVEADLVHPNELAIQYIWNKFVSICCEKSTREIISKVHSLNQKMNHEFLHPSTDSAKHFQEQLLLDISEFKQLYPQVKLADWKPKIRNAK